MLHEQMKKYTGVMGDSGACKKPSL